MYLTNDVYYLVITCAIDCLERFIFVSDLLCVDCDVKL